MPYVFPILEGCPARAYFTSPTTPEGATSAVASNVPGSTRAWNVNWRSTGMHGRLLETAIPYGGGTAVGSPIAGIINWGMDWSTGVIKTVIDYTGRGSLNAGHSASVPAYSPIGRAMAFYPPGNMSLPGFVPQDGCMFIASGFTYVPIVVIPYVLLGYKNYTITPNPLPPNTPFTIQVFTAACSTVQHPTLSANGTVQVSATELYNSGYFVGWTLTGTSPAQPGTFNLSVSCSETITYLKGEVLTTEPVTHFPAQTIPITVAAATDTQAPRISAIYLGGESYSEWGSLSWPLGVRTYDDGSGIAKIEWTAKVSLAGQTKTNSWVRTFSPPKVQSTWDLPRITEGQGLDVPLSSILPTTTYYLPANGTGTADIYCTVTDAAGNVSSATKTVTLIVPTVGHWRVGSDTHTVNTYCRIHPSVTVPVAKRYAGQTADIAFGGVGLSAACISSMTLDGGTPLTKTPTGWLLPSTIADGSHTILAKFAVDGYADTIDTATLTWTEAGAPCDCDGGCDNCDCDGGGGGSYAIYVDGIRR